jgi:hypothetical protein
VLSFCDCVVTLFRDDLDEEEIEYFYQLREYIYGGNIFKVSDFVADVRCPLWRSTWIQKWMTPADFALVAPEGIVHWHMMYQWFLEEISRAHSHKLQVALHVFENGESSILALSQKIIHLQSMLSNTTIELHDIKEALKREKSARKPDQ